MNKNLDKDAIHAIGNGDFLIYSAGPDIKWIYGPNYSSPSYGEIVCNAEYYDTHRKTESNCWEHDLHFENGTVHLTDVMSHENNIFVRKIRSEVSCSFSFKPEAYVKTYFRQNYAVGDDLIRCAVHLVPPGSAVAVRDATHYERRMIFLSNGCAEIDETGRIFRISKGEGEIRIIVTEPKKQNELLSEALKNYDYEEADKQYWKSFLEKGKSIRMSIPACMKDAERIQNALESVAVQIKAQQSALGGVMAGQWYPMAYVRDQAGVLRGLLSMGYFSEAKQIIEFWYSKWKKYGNLFNAEAMAAEDNRLMFSNDEVEVPAYIVLSLMEYHRITKDDELIIEMFDMLKWAVNIQLKHLVQGMTCFSGDETYIAGHIFPRVFLQHGSAESTLLFIESTKRALEFEKGKNLFEEEELCRIRNALQEAEANYHDNFVKNGIIYCNNPEREQFCKIPDFIFGYCPIDELDNRPSPLTWLEKGPDGVYRCMDCVGRPVNLNCAMNKRFILSSVSLLPSFFHSDLLTEEELRKNAEPFLQEFERTGKISSEYGTNRALGYDFGLLLYTAAMLKCEQTEEILSFVLDEIDSRGMWAEYYLDGQPYNCRCRPWESGINIAAILLAVEKIKEKENQ